MDLFKKIFEKNLSAYHERKTPEYPGKLTGANVAGVFSGCDDFEARCLAAGVSEKSSLTIYYIDGIVDSADISQLIIQPLTDVLRFGAPKNSADCIERIQRGGVYCASMRRRTTLDDVIGDITRGYAALVFDEENVALCFEARTSFHRSISEPREEKSVKGSKDSFVENIRINTSLIRRKLLTPNLKIKQQVCGRKSHTAVAIIYVEGVADPGYVSRLTRRIEEIDIDSMLTTAHLEETLADHPRSPFPQLLYTERPDKFAMNLLEGRVGIMADGIPLGFLSPATLSQFLKVPEDDSHHFIVSSVLTLLRYLGLCLSLLVPALYVAVALYHQEMIPTQLLISVIDSKQQVPFSTFIEILAMLIAFELLQEAGLRLPDPIGQSVSIIGALIVGQSAVEARVVSPIAVIVVALAGIAGYTCPNNDLGSALRIMRFALVLLALAGGMFGIMCGVAVLLWHLCTLESLGVAYLSPLCDAQRLSMLKALTRVPLWMNKSRDRALHTPDRRKRR